MFKYAFQATAQLNKTLLSGLTIWGDTITFYLAEVAMTPHVDDTGLSCDWVLNTTNACFEGTLLGPLSASEFGHDIRPNHPADAPEPFHHHHKHIHLAKTSLITPDDCRCILDKIIESQTNITAREANISPKNFRVMFKRMSLKFAHGPLAEPYLDARTPLIDVSRVDDIKKNFDVYYTNNHQAVEKKYAMIQEEIKQYRLDQSYADEALIIALTGLSAFKSGVFTGASITLALKLLQYAGVSDKQANWSTHVLSLLFIAYVSQDLTPLMLSVITLILTKACDLSDRHASALTSATAVAASAIHVFNDRRFGVVNAGAALLANYTGTLFGQCAVSYSSSLLSQRVNNISHETTKTKSL